MKIGIESQRIFRTSKHGMDVVAVELITQLQKLDRESQYVLFAKNGDDRQCIRDTPNFRTKIVGGLTYADWEQVSLPAAVKKVKPDILHCTANTAPFNVPVPLIVTIHDIIYLEETSFEGSAYQNFGNLYRKFVVPKAIQHAKKIVTVSEYEKGVITDVCNVAPDKIEVIHNGVSERFHSEYSTEQVNAFREQYTLPSDFILFLGNTAPKKNTTGALKAYIKYHKASSDPLPLVVTDYSAAAVSSLLQKYGALNIKNSIITPGYVSSIQMPLMYCCASLFIYPSLRESFGLPVLEAMACGIPVITSDMGALREVGGDAAAYIDAESDDDIAEQIGFLLSNDAERKSFVEKGKERVKLFSWEKSARQLIKLYRRVSEM